MRLIITFISLCCFFIKLEAQDSTYSDIKRTIKSSLIHELDLGLLTLEKADDFFNRELKLNELTSRGFNDFLFFSIPNQVVLVDSNYEKKLVEHYKLSPIVSEDSIVYIVGYHVPSNSVYHLQGFSSNNDFACLYYSFWRTKGWPSKKSLNKKRIRMFCEQMIVKGLDFKFLLKELKENNEKDLCNNKLRYG